MFIKTEYIEYDRNNYTYKFLSVIWGNIDITCEALTSIVLGKNVDPVVLSQNMLPFTLKNEPSFVYIAGKRSKSKICVVLFLNSKKD